MSDHRGNWKSKYIKWQRINLGKPTDGVVQVSVVQVSPRFKKKRERGLGEKEGYKGYN